MNELPVIGSLCLHKDFWNRHVANILSTGVHIILGNSECRRITTTEPQRAGREWDPVATYTKMG